MGSPEASWQVTPHRASGLRARKVTRAAPGDASPILLVHGWPETWWAFHKVIPVLAKTHRVFAVDLRGFGASDIAMQGDNSTTIAEDLHALIGHLDLGGVHLAAQDFRGRWLSGWLLSIRGMCEALLLSKPAFLGSVSNFSQVR